MRYTGHSGCYRNGIDNYDLPRSGAEIRAPELGDLTPIQVSVVGSLQLTWLGHRRKFSQNNSARAAPNQGDPYTRHMHSVSW
jgi:hypothetical protein